MRQKYTAIFSSPSPAFETGDKKNDKMKQSSDEFHEIEENLHEFAGFRFQIFFFLEIES